MRYSRKKAATIVGATTYGAANNNKIFPIPPQFILSVSYARPLSAVTGTNWEGTGVTPDIAVRAVDACTKAQLVALEQLSNAPASSEQERKGASWTRVALEAQLEPAILSSERLQTLVGTYGPVTISLSQGQLRLSRGDRPKWPRDILLSPLTQDGLFEAHAFAFDDLRVRLTNAELEFQYGSTDSKESIQRSP